MTFWVISISEYSVMHLPASLSALSSIQTLGNTTSFHRQTPSSPRRDATGLWQPPLLFLTFQKKPSPNKPLPGGSLPCSYPTACCRTMSCGGRCLQRSPSPKLCEPGRAAAPSRPRAAPCRAGEGAGTPQTPPDPSPVPSPSSLLGVGCPRAGAGTPRARFCWEPGQEVAFKRDAGKAGKLVVWGN